MRGGAFRLVQLSLLIVPGYLLASPAKKTGRRERRAGEPFPVTFSDNKKVFSGNSCISTNSAWPLLDVTYTNDPRSVASWLSESIGNGGSCLGFDTETKPNNFKLNTEKGTIGPAILQLATMHGQCLVVQLGSWSWHRKETKALLRSLDPVLSDHRIPKVGVGIDDDCIDLWRASKGKIEVNGRVDIGGVGVFDCSVNPRTRGLSNLTQAVLGITVSKPKRIQMSNWGARAPLSVSQIKYAAVDAFAAAAVHAELASRRQDLFEPPVLAAQAARARSLRDLSERRSARRQLRGELKEISSQAALVERVIQEREAGTLLASTWNADFVNVGDLELELEKLRLRGIEGNMRWLKKSLRPDEVVFYDPKEIGL